MNYRHTQDATGENFWKRVLTLRDTRLFTEVPRRRILRTSKPARRVYRSHASVRSYPASASTAWAPTPISEATLPSASTSTADGVPVAPKARPVENC
jgi:hypothetical protein